MMSIEEQDAAMLRIVKERSEAKRRRSLLEHELRTAGSAFHDLGGALRHLNSHSFNQNPDYFSSLLKRARSLDSGKVAEMLGEYVDLDGKIRDLDARAKELNID